MAELRYQMTNMLEEECKRRAYIEQASLQRIAELEAQVILLQYHSACYWRRAFSLYFGVWSCLPDQIRKEQGELLAVGKHLHEAKEIAALRAMEVCLSFCKCLFFVFSVHFFIRWYWQEDQKHYVVLYYLIIIIILSLFHLGVRWVRHRGQCAILGSTLQVFTYLPFKHQAYRFINFGFYCQWFQPS